MMFVRLKIYVKQDFYHLGISLYSNFFAVKYSKDIQKILDGQRFDRAETRNCKLLSKTKTIKQVP